MFYKNFNVEVIIIFSYNIFTRYNIEISMLQFASISLAFLFNLLVPVRCIGCRVLIENKGLLCAKCWGSIYLIYANSCFYCGMPKPSQLCFSCSLVKKRRPITMRSALAYKGIVVSIINHLKSGHGAHLAKPISRLLIKICFDVAQEIDIVVPVPMHWLSLLHRRYNQAALLANNVADFYNLPVVNMRKMKMTKRQRTLSRARRLANLRGVFSAPTSIAGKTVLLIDDVITTGATVHEASSTLLRAGAKKVHIISLARTC